ncbi:MAG: hypothetical protein CMM01_10900 [Rhodopirellula sp.]|nr:hypothetical protein [Rhodopirellula sp.]
MGQTTEQTGSTSPPKGTIRVTDTHRSCRLLPKGFSFHRKGAPPLRRILPIVRSPRKDLGPQFAGVDDFTHSSEPVLMPELSDSVGFQAERAAKTA